MVTRKTHRVVGALVESLESRRMLAALTADFAFWRPSNANMRIDTNRDQVVDSSWTVGATGDQVVAGDFNGDTVSDIAVFRKGTWFIYSASNPGVVSRKFVLGMTGKQAVAGDANGDGKADVGIYSADNKRWRIDTNLDGVPELNWTFGVDANDKALLGDVNGDGYADAVIFNKGKWSISYRGNGKVDQTVTFGNASGIPFLADFDGDGRPDLGVYYNGTWSIDTNQDGKADLTYLKGWAGDMPVPGYFKTTGATFVRAGASGGNGTFASPFGTISAALQATGSSTMIRVAAGTYKENLYYGSRDSVSLIGAGFQGSVIAPSSGDAVLLDRCTNVLLEKIGFRSGDRGLVLMGSDVTGYQLGTAGTQNLGVLTTNYIGRNSTLYLQDSHLDGMVVGDAVRLQSGTAATFRSDTFNNNGTNFGAIPRGLDGGRGLVIMDTCSADIRFSRFDHNAVSGISTTDSAKLTLRDSYVGYSQHFNNIHISANTSALISWNTIENAGTIRDVGNGFNGIEIANAYTGPGITVTSNTFRNNTSAGIYVGNGRNHVISGNMFDNNIVGVNLNGYLEPGISTGPIDVYAKVTGNTFLRSASSTDNVQLGIYALGSYSHGQIGGSAAADYNTFWNYASGYSIFRASLGGNPYVAHGAPDLTILNNYYYNSPNPISSVYG